MFDIQLTKCENKNIAHVFFVLNQDIIISYFSTRNYAEIVRRSEILWISRMNVWNCKQFSAIFHNIWEKIDVVSCDFTTVYLICSQAFEQHFQALSKRIHFSYKRQVLWLGVTLIWNYFVNCIRFDNLSWKW